MNEKVTAGLIILLLIIPVSAISIDQIKDTCIQQEISRSTGSCTTNLTCQVGPAGPPGSTGSNGTSASVAVNHTFTLNPGVSATVTNVGSSSAALFDFGIPIGNTGATGPMNQTPNQTANMTAGSPGSPGSAATVAVNHTFTLNPGVSATVTNVGSSSAALFDFGIPTGNTGPTGPMNQTPNQTANMTMNQTANMTANMTAGPPGSIPDVSQFLFINGTRSMAGILDMAGYAISNIKGIINPSDAVNLSYLQGHIINNSYLTSVDQTWNASYDTIANQSTVNASIRSAIVAANNSQTVNLSASNTSMKAYVDAKGLINNSYQTIANQSSYDLAVNETWKNNLTAVNTSMKAYVDAVNTTMRNNVTANNVSMKAYVDAVNTTMRNNVSANFFMAAPSGLISIPESANATFFERNDEVGGMSFRGSGNDAPGAAMNFYGRNSDVAVTGPPGSFYLFTNNSAGSGWISVITIMGGDIPVTHFANGRFNFDANNITSVKDPVAAQDAATKNYVDTKQKCGATASVADGGTITHGFGATPTYVLVTGSVANNVIDVTAKSSTTFTTAIKLGSTGGAGSTQTIYWCVG